MNHMPSNLYKNLFMLNPRPCFLGTLSIKPFYELLVIHRDGGEKYVRTIPENYALITDGYLIKTGNHLLDDGVGLIHLLRVHISLKGYWLLWNCHRVLEASDEQV